MAGGAGHPETRAAGVDLSPLPGEDPADLSTPRRRGVAALLDPRQRARLALLIAELLACVLFAYALWRIFVAPEPHLIREDPVPVVTEP